MSDAFEAKKFYHLVRRLANQKSASLFAHRAPHTGRSFGAGCYVKTPRNSAQRVVVKARVVKTRNNRKNIQEHAKYLCRDGLFRDNQQLVAYDGSDDLTRTELRDRTVPWAEDRHTFRFIVSPEGAADLDLKEYTRELVAAMEADLSTRLEWIAVNHHNTDNPHAHILIRGRRQDGGDLVMKRDYIGQGVRARASEIATRYLGPRNALDFMRQLDREATAERLTSLDREILRRSGEEGEIDIGEIPKTPETHARRNATLRRLIVLRDLGLAEEPVPGIWRIRGDAAAVLKDMGERRDIIKTMHKRIKGMQLKPECIILSPKDNTPPITGMVIDKGLADELTGTKYLIMQARGGTAYYIPLSEWSEPERRESDLGSIVTIRAARAAGRGRYFFVEAHTCGLLIDCVQAPGPTWLDGELARGAKITPKDRLLSDSDRQISEALRARSHVLAERGLAAIEADGTVRTKEGLLVDLRAAQKRQLAGRLGNAYGSPLSLREGEEFTGRVASVEPLSDGPAAVVTDGHRYVVVPYKTGMDHLKQSGRQITVTKTRDRRGVEREQYRYTTPRRALCRGPERDGQ
jgi:type IV secretory pathway VirD2 relaxase